MIQQSAPSIAAAHAPLPVTASAIGAQPVSVAAPDHPRVNAHAVATPNEPHGDADLSRLTLLDAVDRPSTGLLTYELRRLLQFPQQLALWGDGALAQAAKVGNAEAVQLYMLFIGRDAKLLEGNQQLLLWGRSGSDPDKSLLHQAAGGFGSEQQLTREQQYSAGVYLSTLLALPMLESFKLDVIGDVNRSDAHGLQTSARIALQRGHLGLATELMGAILDARSTPQERAARLDALGIAPDELLAALRQCGQFPGSLGRLEASLARTQPRAEPVDALRAPAPLRARVSARVSALASTWVASLRRTPA